MARRTKKQIKKSLPRAVSKKPVKPLLSAETEPVKRTRIKVVGIGGGGGNIVSELAARVKKIFFAAANTDKQSLKQLRRNVSSFQFGESVTRGLGTGMNQEVARTAALQEKEKIKKLFQGYDFCVLVSSLGGGAGSGATPVFAKEAKSSGAITLGVFTLPFKFEGEKKQELARESLQKIRPYLSALAVLPNDRIFQTIDKNTPLKDAFSFVNKNLADALEGLIETVYMPGLINIDFADLRAILQGYGKIAYLNTVEVQGQNQAMEAVKRVLNSPLYPYTLKGAKKVLFNITGDKELSLHDVSQISRMIFDQTFSQAQIIFGITHGQNSQDKIKVSVLATGFQSKTFLAGPETSKDPKKKKIKKSKKAGVKAKTKPKPKAKAKPKKRRTKIKLEVEEEIPQLRPPEEAIRKNALQIKQEAEAAEKEFMEKEKFWEAPSFLRNKQKT